MSYSDISNAFSMKKIEKCPMSLPTQISLWSCSMNLQDYQIKASFQFHFCPFDHICTSVFPHLPISAHFVSLSLGTMLFIDQHTCCSINTYCGEKWVSGRKSEHPTLVGLNHTSLQC